MNRFAFALALAAASVFVSGSLVAVSAQDDVKTLIETKCSLCHSPKKALDHTAEKSFWEETVKRMQSKLPEKISNEDVKAITEYLSTNNVPK